MSCSLRGVVSPDTRSDGRTSSLGPTLFTSILLSDVLGFTSPSHTSPLSRYRRAIWRHIHFLNPIAGVEEHVGRASGCTFIFASHGNGTQVCDTKLKCLELKIDIYLWDWQLGLHTFMAVLVGFHKTQWWSQDEYKLDDDTR